MYKYFIIIFMLFVNNNIVANDQEIKQLLINWVQSLKSQDPDQMTELYSSNGVLLPNISNKIKIGKHEINQYFKVFFINQPEVKIVQQNIKFINQNYATNNGVYSFKIKDNNHKIQLIISRYIFIYEKVNDKWLINVHYSSMLPESFNHNFIHDQCLLNLNF